MAERAKFQTDLLLKKEIESLKVQLAQEQGEKKRICEAFESLLITKNKLEEELSKLRSKPKKPEFEDPNDRRRTESVLALSQADFMKKISAEPEDRTIDLSVSVRDSVRDTMLLDKIDNFQDLFEGFNSRQSILFNSSAIKQSLANIAQEESNPDEPTRDQLLVTVSEKERIIENLQKDLKDKTDEVEILRDEMSLCRSNLKALQQKLRENRGK